MLHLPRVLLRCLKLIHWRLLLHLLLLDHVVVALLRCLGYPANPSLIGLLRLGLQRLVLHLILRCVSLRSEAKIKRRLEVGHQRLAKPLLLLHLLLLLLLLLLRLHHAKLVVRGLILTVHTGARV